MCFILFIRQKNQTNWQKTSEPYSLFVWIPSQSQIHVLAPTIAWSWRSCWRFVMCQSYSLCSLVNSLLLDIRPCWTAGRESHWNDQPSLSWWKGWETFFRPVCNRYDRHDCLSYKYHCVKKSSQCNRFVSTVAGTEHWWWWWWPMISSCWALVKVLVPTYFTVMTCYVTILVCSSAKWGTHCRLFRKQLCWRESCSLNKSIQRSVSQTLGSLKWHHQSHERNYTLTHGKWCNC